MTPEIIALILVTSWAVAGVAVLFFGGRLIRYDSELDRTEDTSSSRKPSRLMEDLRPFQNLVVEFFGHSEYVTRVLNVLARHEEPLKMKTLVQEAHLSAEPHQKGAVALTHVAWPAACILAATGLVRLRRGGLVLTDIGREVQRRIWSDSAARSTHAESLAANL